MENDSVEIHSGIFEGFTLGTPISMSIPNKDARSTDYKPDQYRPSHADYTYDQKYGHRDWRGGGRLLLEKPPLSAMVCCKAVLNHFTNSQVLAWVEQVHNINSNIVPNQVTLEEIESNIVRCPDQVAAKKMISLIEQTREQGDSLGGIIQCYCSGIPAGLGEPVFDKLEADLAKAMLSIPATKGFSIGSGFNSIYLTYNNDSFVNNKKIETSTNHSGGIQGGISNGIQLV